MPRPALVLFAVRISIKSPKLAISCGGLGETCCDGMWSGSIPCIVKRGVPTPQEDISGAIVTLATFKLSSTHRTLSRFIHSIGYTSSWISICS
ncbi:hypothetical protein BGZ57DRAFT_909110 [Hyaloscypha finlandica]|nr:hypothetical protein BGZ57DRAFT_909110 [Hyaloscypha finlandica]